MKRHFCPVAPRLKGHGGNVPIMPALSGVADSILRLEATGNLNWISWIAHPEQLGRFTSVSFRLIRRNVCFSQCWLCFKHLFCNALWLTIFCALVLFDCAYDMKHELAINKLLSYYEIIFVKKQNTWRAPCAPVYATIQRLFSDFSKSEFTVQTISLLLRNDFM